MPVRPSPDRREAGNKPSRTQTRDDRKKVAESRAKQKEDKARKDARTAFEKRRKELAAALAAQVRLKAALEKLRKEGEAKAKLDKGIIDLVGKTAKLIVQVTRTEARAHATVVDRPQVLAQVAQSVQRLPDAGKAGSPADLAVTVATLIVLLKRLIELKLRKD